MSRKVASTDVPLRSPDRVMRLARLGSMHQMRLSFLRALLRRMRYENWQVACQCFDIDERGVGTAIYTVRVGERLYSLVGFGHEIPPEKRTDRVIAEVWDATFVLHDGLPDDDAVKRLRANVPLQEAGRFLESELILARANRSVRLFDHVVSALSAGRQPDRTLVESTGYLMRTTAVYGNGKFGLADRDHICDRPEFADPFRAEMLTVYLIRLFTVDLAEHLARLRGGKDAALLERELRRRFGIGNSTGLGMAPFLVRHPALLDRWVSARETALARARSRNRAEPRQTRLLRELLRSSHIIVGAWVSEDPDQSERIGQLRKDLRRLDEYVSSAPFDELRPFDRLYRYAEAELSLEGQEYCVTLLIEVNDDIVDELADAMAVDEGESFRIDGTMRCEALHRLVQDRYGWALKFDFRDRAALARFWYTSEEKLEPRLGERFEEPGMESEQPLAVARDIAALLSPGKAAVSPHSKENSTRGDSSLFGNPRQPHRRCDAADRHPAMQARILRSCPVRSAIGPVGAHHLVPRQSLSGRA
jgi:hypothetical protein